MKIIATLALVVIAICQLSKTVDIYVADNGGYNIFLGNFGYHIAMGSN